MSLEAWNWQELLLVGEGEDKLGADTNEDNKEIKSLLEWNLITLGGVHNLWQVIIREPLLLSNWGLGWKEYVGQEPYERSCDGPWEYKAYNVANNSAKVGEVVFWIVAVVHDTAPFSNRLGGNGISDVGHNLSTVHGSPLFLEIGDQS